jgi:hypothetical protein
MDEIQHNTGKIGKYRQTLMRKNPVVTPERERALHGKYAKARTKATASTRCVKGL